MKAKKIRNGIRRIKKTGGNNNIRRIKKTDTKKNSIFFKNQLGSSPVNKKSHITTTAQQKGIKRSPVKEELARKIIERQIKHFKGGFTVKNALSLSSKIDIDRAESQLKLFAIRSFAKGVFKFKVKQSGLYGESPHQTEIKWEDAETLAKKTDKNAKQIFETSTIKTQCSCERFTYWYRYLATAGGWVLGVKEYRFPVKTNFKLKGSLCKHQILLMRKIKTPAFLRVFERYIENIRKGTKTRIKDKDVLSTFGASARSKNEEED